MRILSRKEYPLKNTFPVTLETLVICQCTLKVFDKRILRLHNLQVLDLSRNNLTTLCESLDSLGNLRSLNLSYNNFHIFPQCILKGKTACRLTTLDMCYNNLTYIPPHINILTNLSVLKLNNNKLQLLSPGIGYLRSLQQLDCSNNQLLYLPWTFSMLQLESIDLSQNLLDQKEPGVLERDEKKISNLLSTPSLFETTARYIIKNSLQ